MRLVLINGPHLIYRALIREKVKVVSAEILKVFIVLFLL